MEQSDKRIQAGRNKRLPVINLWLCEFICVHFQGGFALSFILYKADIKCIRGKRLTECGNWTGQAMLSSQS